MSSDPQLIDARTGGRAHALTPPAGRSLGSRAWAIVAALSVTESVSWGILYYAFAAFLAPMRADLGLSTAQLTGAFSLGLLVAGLAGIPVGRYLDRHSPRPLMTAWSIAAVTLVVAWSRIDGLFAFYALWVAIGLVMATVLYEPAFTVLAKHFPVAEQRRRAMTAMTLVAALASFIFLPLTQALIDAHGWRDALLVSPRSSPPSRSHCTRSSCAAHRARVTTTAWRHGRCRRAGPCGRHRSGCCRWRSFWHPRPGWRWSCSRSRSWSSAATAPGSPRSPSA